MAKVCHITSWFFLGFVIFVDVDFVAAAAIVAAVVVIVEHKNPH